MSRSVPDTLSAAERYERLLGVHALMVRVSREIGPATDLDHVLGAVMGALGSLVPYDGGLISLTEDDHQVIVASDPPDGVGRTITHPPEGAVAVALRTNSSIRCDDVCAPGALTAEERAEAARRGIVSFLAVPLVCLGQTIGLIHVYSSLTAAFDDEAQLLLEGLASQVAGAIESARRYEMITHLEVLKSDFIARVSHELRTPITIMSGFVSTLLTNHDRLDDDTRRRMLERVDVATARLSGLIDELLMLSRLEAGVVAATVEDVAARPLLEEVARQSERPEAISVECAEGLRLATDQGLLIRALGFLVDNALKYAGSCRVIAGPGRIEIVDDGPGIPADRRSHVFEAFTRANEDTTVAGMGIGLPMARTLLAAAGAELRVEEPEDGTGTRMVATFW